jgi:NodT family efflux transporter outer membrane factor (OMF) lipoprotein
MTGIERLRATSTMVALAALAGCTVGPDYHGPGRLPVATSFVRGSCEDEGPPASRWWTLLGDDELDRLEAAAVAASPDVAAASARLREARAGVGRALASLRPTTGGNALYVHDHGPQSLFANGAQGMDLYDVAVDATWEIDLFGAGRRAAEGARADAGASLANLEDAKVSLAAAVADAYVDLIDARQRMALASAAADLQDQTVALGRKRLAGGTASELDVRRLEADAGTTRAGIAPIRQAAVEAEDRLAILAGREPGTLDAELASRTSLPRPPDRVALGDPASLIRRRPDVRAAERLVASRNAAIGQRVADYFPKVTLLGDVGFGATQPGQVFTGGALSAIGGPMLQWKPFDFGRTAALVEGASAARDEAAAEWRSTVLRALGDAENAVARLGTQRERVAQLRLVRESAARAADLERRRYEGGTASLTDELDVERQRIRADRDLASAEADLVKDFVALEKSLGMGWGAPDDAPVHPAACR